MSTGSANTSPAPDGTTQRSERWVAPLRRRAEVASAILLGLVAVLGLGACRSGPQYSHFTVYNQTTVPIVFTVAKKGAAYGDYYVLPCSSAQFIYGSGTGGWAPVDPSSQPPPAPTDAVRFSIGPGPAAEGSADTTWWMTSTGLQYTHGIVVPSLPPCDGPPPSSGPGIITPPPTAGP